MKEQIKQRIHECIETLRSFLQAHIGDIDLPNKKKFLQPGDSGFRRSVLSRVDVIDRCFGEEGIPENLQGLIVSHVVRQILEVSPPYLNTKKKLPYTQQRDLDHELTLFFTQHPLLKDQRKEPSHKDLEGYRPSYNPRFHGEFSYALLHILNQQSLHVPPESFDLLREIGTTTGTAAQLTSKEGALLGWKNATPYGIDAQLPQRKQAFCAAIDERQPRNFLNSMVRDETAPHAPITLAIWDRNASVDRQPERRLSLKFIQNMVTYTQERIKDRPLHLLILGDKGRLQGLEAWARERDISYHDHRDEHMLEPGSPPGSPLLPKNEQLYRVRHIMKAFNPSLIVGPRAGLIALCSLVGCAGLQIGLGSEQSTKTSSRVQRQPHDTPAIEASHKSNDNRLFQVFSRCPTDGIGPYLNITMNTPNPDKAVVHSSNQEILNLTLSVMMVERPEFKPLMLETLASYLCGDAEALQKLRHLLDTYQTYDANLKEQAEAQAKLGFHASSEYKRDDHDTGGGSSPDRDKKSGGDSSPGGRSSPPDESKPSGHEPTTSHQRGHQRSAMPMMLTESVSYDYNKEITMNSELFFEGFKTEIESHQKHYLDFTPDDQSNLLIDGVLNLNLDDFKHLYTTIIPEEHHTRLLRHDAFLVFEYALSYPEHLSFLLKQLSDDDVIALLDNGNLLRCALQLSEDDYEKASNAFNQLKSFGQAKTNWSNILIKHDYLVIRSIAEHMGAENAWAQCNELTCYNKKHALIADNYMMFRRASLSPNRTALICTMSEYLNHKEFQEGVNAYGGDVVYHAILKEDQTFFNHYYPMLTDENQADLAARVSTQGPAESFETFERFKQESLSYQSPPRTRRAAQTMYLTPPSVASSNLFTPPRSEERIKTRQEDLQELARKSSSLFAHFTCETPSKPLNIVDSEESQLDTPAI
jgi:hypothetical protein